MIKRILNFIRGYLIIEIRGNALERFITQLVDRGIILWQVERISNDYYRARILARDFNKLRPVVRRRLCTVKIRQKRGLGFLLNKITSHYLLVLGIILLLAVFWLASSFIWFIDIEGNKRIPAARIYFILAKNGVRRGVLKNNIDLESLEQNLLREEPRLAWVDLTWQGTGLNIEMVEKKVVTETKKGDLVAARDGIIREIIVMKGRAVVEEGATVRAGEKLIVGLSETGERVRARGVVKASVWYSGSAVVKREEIEVYYTGQRKKIPVLKTGMGEIRLLPRPDFEKYTVNREVKSIKWRNYDFPVELIIEDYREVRHQKIERSRETALFMARERVLDRILTAISSGAVIIDVKSKIKEIDDNMVKVRVLMQVEEDIGKINIE